MWVFIFRYLLRGEGIPHKSTQRFSKISVYSDIFVQGGIRGLACLQYNSVLLCVSSLSTDGFQVNNMIIK